MKQKLEQKPKQSNQTMIRKSIKLFFIILAALLLVFFSIFAYDRLTIGKTYFKQEKNLKIPIFVYHNIVKTQQEIEHDYMQTTAKTFEKQLNGLQKAGYHFISYDDLIAYQKGEKKLYKKSAIITFDDGWEGVYQNAYPILQNYNIPATCFLIDENMGKETVLKWEQVRQMKQSGLISFYSHGKQHLYYDKVSPNQLAEDTLQAHQKIEKELGEKQTRIFTYPYGVYTEETVKTLEQQGFVQNLTDNKINTSKKLNLSKLHRCYPLSDPVWKILLKIEYRSIRYGG